MTHGSRTAYQAGCRCLPCHVANAEYMADYRLRKRAGRVLLGAKIASDAAKRLLDQLHKEHVTKLSIAQALGLRKTRFPVHPRITVRNHLKIQRLHRRYMSEAADPEGFSL